MSNLSSFSVLNEKVNKIHSEEGTEKVGHAFMNLCLRTLFKLSDEELEEALTDGPQDGEVDAIYIADRIVHILTFKYTDQFKLSLKNFPGTDLDQFTLTVDAIISGTLDKKTVNDAVWDKFKEIESLATSGKIEFKIYVISNKLYPADNAQKKLQNVLDKFRRVQKPFYMDQDDLVSVILEDKYEKIDGSLKFIEKQHFEKSDGNIKTVIGSVACLDFIKLIKEDDKSVKENAFNENVRIYKPKHRVNQAIIQSALSEDNYQFFYLNNGITILTEEVDYAPNTRSPHVELKNFQIINGGQTSHSLFEVYKTNPDKIETIDILIRICEAKKDDPLSEKISESSNNQIPVGSRDLHSNDLIQRKLEEEFLSLGYFYERKPNQHSKELKSKVIGNEVLGQLFMAYHLDMPSEAKNNKSKVFSELYDQIFNEDIVTAKELLRLYNLYLPLLEKKKLIQKKKREKKKIAEKDAFISRAIFHVIYGVKLLYENEELKIEKKKISEKEKMRRKEALYPAKDAAFIKKAIKLIFEKVEEQMEARGDLYTHDKFFKEVPTNSIIGLHIRNSLKSKQK